MRPFRSNRFPNLLLCMVFAFGSALAAPKAFVGNFKDSTVSVIDTGSGTVIATVPVAHGPHGMALAPDGRELFVTGDESSNMSIIDTATDRVLATMEVGKTPHGLAMASDGSVLLVAIYGEDRIAFVNPALRTVIGSVSVQKPHAIAMSPDGSLAYVASQEPGHFGLAKIDVATRSVLHIVPLDKAPRDPEWSFDAKVLYFTLAGVNAVQVLDPTSDRIIGKIPTGESPHIAGHFRGVRSGTALVQGPGEVLLFDAATNAPLRSIRVGKQPHWMAATSDGKALYVTDEGGNDVTVIDLGTAHTHTIAVGAAPRKIVLQRSAAISTSVTTAAKISIAHFAFAPAVVTVAPGQAVTWTNADGAPHGVAYADGKPGANPLLPGESFSRTYDEVGSYDYSCPIHPYMQGKIIVRPQ